MRSHKHINKLSKHQLDERLSLLMTNLQNFIPNRREMKTAIFLIKQQMWQNYFLISKNIIFCKFFVEDVPLNSFQFYRLMLNIFWADKNQDTSSEMNILDFNEANFRNKFIH